MKLEVGYIDIQDFAFGESNGLKDRRLVINKAELGAYLKELDHRICELELDIVHPGESVRIMPVKDVVEPRVKVSGDGCIFPGHALGEESMVGEGRTHVLKGVGVVTTGRVVGFQEGIIDMSGPGADYTPFSKLMNLVVRAEVEDSCNQYEHEAILRRIGMEAARWIGQWGRMPSRIVSSVMKPSLLSSRLPNILTCPRLATSTCCRVRACFTTATTTGSM